MDSLSVQLAIFATISVVLWLSVITMTAVLSIARAQRSASRSTPLPLPPSGQKSDENPVESLFNVQRWLDQTESEERVRRTRPLPQPVTTIPQHTQTTAIVDLEIAPDAPTRDISDATRNVLKRFAAKRLELLEQSDIDTEKVVS